MVIMKCWGGIELHATLIIQAKIAAQDETQLVSVTQARRGRGKWQRDVLLSLQHLTPDRRRGKEIRIKRRADIRLLRTDIASKCTGGRGHTDYAEDALINMLWGTYLHYVLLPCI